MFLSRLSLNPLSPKVMRDVASPLQLHKTVLKGFDTGDSPSPRSHLQVLHRLEVDQARGQINLLVQSEPEPAWDNLPEHYILLQRQNPGVRLLEPVLDGVATGAQYRFRLRANPTRTFTADGRKQKIELRGDEERLAWLTRQGEKHGFELATSAQGAEVRIVEEAKIGGRKSGASGGHQVTIKPVLFDGRLCVRDARAFVEAIRGGVGRGKAYGCGLISLAP